MGEATINGLTVRRAQRGDLPRLLELLADDALGKNREGVGSDDPAYIRAFDAIDRDPNQQLIVADLDGRVVGMLQITYIPGLSRRGAWRANIEAVRVDSGVREGDKVTHFYDRLGFADSHVGYKLLLETTE